MAILWLFYTRNFIFPANILLEYELASLLQVHFAEFNHGATCCLLHFAIKNKCFINKVKDSLLG